VPTEFRLPDVGEGLADVEIVEWLVDLGGAVREDDALVEVETDKAVVQITAPVTGTLTEQCAAPGDRLAVGEVLARFAGDDDGAPAAPASTPASTSAPAPATAAPAKDTPTSPAPPAANPARRPRATPSTRGLARELGVDLADVVPSGPGGRVMDEDVRAAAAGGAASAGGGEAGGPATATPAASPRWQALGDVPEDQRVPMRGIRRVIAETMTQAWQTVPHVSSVHEVDMAALGALRARLRDADRPVPVTAFLVKAAALALRQFPMLNASVSEDGTEILQHGHVNIGVAVDADDGLIVPVIRDADRMPVARIGHELRTLAAQARERSLPPERLRGGTFTVNNYGPLGGWFGTSLVKPPEVGILSMAPTRDQVVPVDGEVAIRPIAVMNLAADHRVADGRELIGFCLAVRHAIEEPLTLLLED
jgi:pyruvate/2-oxoglutarate dehydrogenase complex dihydrolipoamide acyltransferase (E2) component